MRLLCENEDVPDLNWSSDRNKLTSNEVIHSYDMVESIEDCSEGHGKPLLHSSKFVGSRLGQEGANAPMGCQELDPASTPLELLQVVTPVRGGEMQGTAYTSRSTCLLILESRRKKNSQKTAT
ncbi:hypothetical protein NL676_035323 [Syzygium grande]|nr:hypothetical protein NL676_035323 [Syzygium grande]